MPQGLDPLNELFNWPRRLETPRPSARSVRKVAGQPRAFPPVNIFRDRHGYLIRMEVPGVSLDELSLEAAGHTLTISAQRAPRKTAGESTHRLERWSGDFSRSIQLPEDADLDSIEASYKRGILDMRVAQHAAAKPRQISITDR